MGFPSGQAASAGVYTTAQGKRLGRSEFSLKLEAITGALNEAGLGWKDVDGIVPLESSMHDPGSIYHAWWAEQLGGRPLSFLGIGQASGGVAKAAAAIAARMSQAVAPSWPNPS